VVFWIMIPCSVEVGTGCPYGVPSAAAVEVCTGECRLYMRQSCLAQGHDRRDTCTGVSEEHIPSSG